MGFVKLVIFKNNSLFTCRCMVEKPTQLNPDT